MKLGKTSIILIGLGASGVILVYTVLPFFTREIYSGLPLTGKPGEVLGVASGAGGQEIPTITHIATPQTVKGIYMTSCYAGSPNLRDSLVTIADTTEVNAIIIDVKDYRGKISFPTDNPELREFVSDQCRADDMKDFIRELHARGIYVLARITAFQDPFFASRRPDLAVKRESDGGVWKDKKGISYLDPGSEEVWDHIIRIAKASYDIGFDEVNFDYIRFPSDGNMRDISFPFSDGQKKADVLEGFFNYLHEHMSAYGIPHSADLFGMTTTNYDDLNIGQVLEKTLPYFDYVMPMVYPSHYPPTFNGWKNPNDYPYELIHFVMKRGAERAVATSTRIQTLGSERIGTSTPAVYTKPAWDKNKLRTWIQDFDYGGDYGPEEVRAQIDASEAVGLSSWIIWSPSNRYTLEALHSDGE